MTTSKKTPARKSAPVKKGGTSGPAASKTSRAKPRPKNRAPAAAPQQASRAGAPGRRGARGRTPTPEPAVLESSPLAPEMTESSPAFVPPEPAFAARVPPPEELPPRPSRRRAIFIDVENTSRLSRVEHALAELAIDRTSATTELVASGNWRVIGNETARLLAAKGAHLVHSAPATGVRDWSDLRIAVSAGVWLASARAGDLLQIVSDDRAFDAVGDVAATLGVTFERLSYRQAEAVAAAAAKREPRAGRGSGRGRGRGSRAGRGESPSPRGRTSTPRSELPFTEATESFVDAVASDTAAPAQTSMAFPDEAALVPQGAPPEDLLAAVRELLQASPGGVTLDAIAQRLKALGFHRPPGSPRLVTRLRSLKELDVSPRGTVKLAGESTAAAEPAAEGAPPPEGAEAPAASGSGRRRRSRGGRGRRSRGGNAPPSAPA